MSDQTTRRMFIQKVVAVISAAAATASGLPMLSSRGDLLNQLAQHITKIGYNVCRYSKF